MENLKLREAVAEVLGCKTVIRTINNLAGNDNTYLFCECEGEKRFNNHAEWVNGKFLIIPYELDDAAALSALKEFCGKNGYEWEIALMSNKRYSCTIWKHTPRAELIADGYGDSLALAICEAIKEAAEGR